MVFELIKSKGNQHLKAFKKKEKNEETSEISENKTKEKVDGTTENENIFSITVNEDVINEFSQEVAKKCRKSLLEYRGVVSPPMFQILKMLHKKNIFLCSEGHAITKVFNSIFFFGGTTVDGTFNNKFFKFNTDTHEFTDLTKEIGQPRSSSYATLNYFENALTNKSCLLLFGGRDGNSELNTTYTYDLKENRWSSENIQEKPTPRCKHIAVTCKKNIIIYGGYSSEKGILNDMWEYDGLSYRKVKYNTKIEPEGRCGHSAVLWLHTFYNNWRIYVFGGDLGKKRGICNELWVYYIAERQWALFKKYSGKPPSPRHMHGCSLFDNELMIIACGLKEASFKNTFLSDFYAYNLNINCWFEIDLKGMARSWIAKRHSFGLMAYVMEKKEMYIFGGMTENKLKPSCDIFKITPLLNYGYYNSECQKLKNDQNKHSLSLCDSFLSFAFSDEMNESKRYNSKEKENGQGLMGDGKCIAGDASLLKCVTDENKNLQNQVSGLISFIEKLSKDLKELKEIVSYLEKAQENYQLLLNERVPFKLFKLLVNKVESLEKKKNLLNNDYESFDNFEKSVYFTYAEGVDIPYNPKKVTFVE